MKKIVTLLFALATVMPIWSYSYDVRYWWLKYVEQYQSSENVRLKYEITYNVYYENGEYYASLDNVTPTGFDNETLEIKAVIAEAFDSIDKIYLYNIPITRIGAYAFAQNIKIKNLIIGNKVQIIDDGAFNSCNITGTLTIPSSVTYIGDNAFYDCQNIQTLVFEEDIDNKELTIGYQAFRKCTGLNGELKIPGRVKRIENAAFRGCSALSTIIISAGVEEIGSEAFAYCGTITDDDIEETPAQPIQRLELPNTLKTIGSKYLYNSDQFTTNTNSVFYNTDIKEVHISLNNNNDIPEMIIGSGDNVQQFSEYTVNNTVFYIPCNTKEYFMAQKGWKDIKNYLSEERGVVRFVVEPEDAAYPSVDWSCNSSDEIYHITLNKQTTDVFLGWYINGTKITSDEDFDFNVKDNEQYLNEDNEYIFTAKFGSVSTAWRWDADKVYVLCNNGDGNSSFGNNIHETTYSATAGQSIILTDYPHGEISLTVPAIVTGNKSISEINMNGTNNIVVCNGATLTINQSLPANTTITVNEDAKLNVTQSVSLDTLVLWANPYENKAAEVIGLNNISNRSTYFDCLLKHDYAVVSFPTTVLFDEITYYDRPNEVSLGAYCYDQTQLGKAVAWENKSIQQRNSFEAGKGYLLWSNDPINTNFERIRFKLQLNISSSRSYSPTLDSGYEEEKFRNWTFTGTLATSTLSQGQGSNIFDNVQEGYVFDDISNAKLIDLENLLPYKGYLIQVPNNFTVTYNESQTPYKMRRVQETASYKTGIILTQEESSDRTIFRIGEQYTPAYDLGSDLAKMFTGKEDLTTYTLLNSTPLAVNATTPELAQLSLPLGFRTVNTDSPLTFSLDSRYNADNISALYLHDNITNTTVNLLAEDYTFTTDLTQDDSRFTLALITQANEDVATALPQNTDNPLYAYGADGTLLVAGFSETVDVSVFDISGRLITNANGCNTTARFSLPAGHYIVNVKQGAQTTILRAIVH